MRSLHYFSKEKESTESVPERTHVSKVTPDGVSAHVSASLVAVQGTGEPIAATRDDGQITQTENINQLASAQTANSSLKYMLSATDLHRMTKALEASRSRISHEQNQYEQRLRQRNSELESSRQHLSLVLDSVSDGLISLSEDGAVASINRAARRVLGCTEEQIIGIPISDIAGQAIPGMDATIGPIELPLRRPDGNIIRVELQGQPLDAGQHRSFIITIRDLTALKDSQRILKEQAFLLHRAQSFFLSLSPSGQIDYCNPYFEQLIGMTGEQLNGRRPWDFVSSHTERRILRRESIDTLTRGRAFKRELEFRHASGRPVWLQFEAHGLHDDDGQLSKVVVLGVDITESKRQEQMQVGFVSMVSHELRTPLTVIAGTLEVLSLDDVPQSGDTYKELIGMCNRNCSQLSRLIEDLLDVNKLGTESVRLQSEYVNAIDVIDEVISDVQPAVTSAGSNIVWAPINTSITVFVDPDRLKQILSNLLSNALKYSLAGTPITVSTSITGSNLRIEVQDCGEGIPMAFHPLIYDKFSRDSKVQDSGQEGFGLGLAICKELVTQMNGQIDFRSTEGIGTRFFVDFPIKETRACVAGEQARHHDVSEA